MINIRRKKMDTNMLVAQEREHILSENTDFFIRESYNTLRSNITFSLTGKGCKIVAVTSTNQSEGKSITALNIAVAYAEINKKVLLIDCDLRKPKVHRLLEIKPMPGLSNILIDESKPADAIQTHEKYGIDVIASGDIPPNSTQLLETEQLEELFEYAKDKYDFVILDTPPINIVIDACILAKHTSGIIYVIRQDYAKKDHILNAVKQLEFSQGRIIGFVLNNITDKGILNLKNTKYGKSRYASYKYEYRTHGHEHNGQQKKGKKEEAKEDDSDTQAKNDKAENKEENEIVALKKNKKKRKRVLITLLVILAILTTAVLIFAKYQENNIQAFKYSRKYSIEELAQKNKAVEEQMQMLVGSLPEVYVQPLDEEARKLLNSGELSEDDAIAIITGTYQYNEEVEADTDKDNKDKDKDKNKDKNKDNNEAVVKAEPVISKTNKLVAEFYLLRAEFLNNIDNLIAQGQVERHAIPKEDRTISVKLDMAKKYAKLGSVLEEECDKEMDSLIGELKKELQATGQSTSIIAEIRELYNEEKAIKKAALIEAYYPRE